MTFVRVQSRVAGTKKTAIDASEAVFITRNVRAGEVRRFSARSGATKPSDSASKSQIAPPVNIEERNQEPSSAIVAEKITMISHGSMRRPNLCERK